MHDYTNLSNKSKELKEYRKAYVKKKIREYALEIFGGIVLFFAMIISFFVEPISTFVKTQKKTHRLPLPQEELAQNGIASPADYADFLNEYLEVQKCPSYILELVNTDIAKCFPEYKEKIEYDGLRYVVSQMEEAQIERQNS